MMSYVDEFAIDEEQPLVVDAVHVQRRVDDWIRRLQTLYQDVTTWAEQNGWAHAEAAPVRMNEELMQLTGIPPRDQPCLVLTSPEGERVWFKPKGLWVIGANGRVDVYTLRNLLLLVDTARQFEPAHWVMHHLPSKPMGGQDFSPVLLARLV